MTEQPGLTGHPILEHALLPVRPGLEAAFEQAFAQAKALIERQPGVGRVSLRHSLESPSSYLLLVEWTSVEAHEHGFRGSVDYQEWKRLLHHFYDPFPVVEHFVEVPTRT